MNILDYLLLHAVVVVSVIQFMNWVTDPVTVLVGKKRAFKSSQKRLERLYSNDWSVLERQVDIQLLLSQEPQQLVVNEVTTRFSQKTGKTVIFVGSFTKNQMTHELLGLDVFESEIASLPVSHIICGHGSGDGRYPQRWVVGGKPVTQWMDELGIKQALVCACETKAVRFCGTYDGRIIRR
jgi:hypothetical protein